MSQTTPTGTEAGIDLDKLAAIADRIDSDGLFKTSGELREMIALARRAAPDSAAQPVQAGEAVDERALFEAWATTNLRHPIMRASNGSYYSSTVDRAWAIWEARASLAPVSAQQGAAVQHNAVECDSALRAEPAGQHKASVSVMADRAAFQEWFNGTMYREDAEEAMLIGWQASTKHYAAKLEVSTNEATRCRAEGGHGDKSRSDAALQEMIDIGQEIGWAACGCHACNKGRVNEHGWPLIGSRMIVCPTCGNKRCPHATNHTLACTGSNEPGQPGSVYGPVAGQEGEQPTINKGEN